MNDYRWKIQMSSLALSCRLSACHVRIQTSFCISPCRLAFSDIVHPIYNHVQFNCISSDIGKVELTWLCTAIAFGPWLVAPLCLRKSEATWNFARKQAIGLASGVIPSQDYPAYTAGRIYMHGCLDLWSLACYLDAWDRLVATESDHRRRPSSELSFFFHTN